jgi:acyl-CoA thioester hydrolase
MRTNAAPSFSAILPPPGFILPVRVYYEDTDAGGVVYYANYLRFCERARSEWLRTLGIGQRGLLSGSGLAFVVRSVRADYLAPARLDDSLAVMSALHDLRHVSVYFLQHIWRGNTRLFTAEVKIACVASGTGRPTPWPETIRARLHDQLTSS